MPGDLRDDLTPDAIPRFPVLRLVWKSDGSITLDDVQIPVLEDEDPRIVALQACAARAHEMGGDAPAIRVTAVDEATGTSYPMAVTGDADVIDLYVGTSQKEPRFSRRAVLLGAAGAGALALGGGTVAAIATIRSLTPEPGPIAAPPPAGQGELVPVAVPEGFAPTALWALPIAANTAVSELPDGRYLTIAPQGGNLRAHDPSTGQVVWTGTGHSASDPVHHVLVDDVPHLVAAKSTSVVLWPLDSGPNQGAIPLSLPSQQGTLYATGPSPALALPTQSGALIGANELTAFDVPVGYQVIGAIDGQAVVLGKSDWGLLTPGDTAVEGIELLLPTAKHEIAGGYLLGKDRLLVRADGPDDSEWLLFATDASNARGRSTTRQRGTLPDPGDLLHSPDKTIWALDGVIATLDAVHVIDQATFTAVTATGVYGTHENVPVRVHPSNGKVTDLAEDSIAPSIQDSQQAVVVADKLDAATAYVITRS